MVYVIKDLLENVLLVRQDRNNTSEEPDRYIIIFSFPWTIYSLKAYLRPWMIPGDGEEKYRLAAINALEEIKSLSEPPEVELRGIYQVPEKISRFKVAISELIEFGLLQKIEFPEDEDYEWITYQDDFLSYLYQKWPEKYVDLGYSYLELGREDRMMIKKLYSLNTRSQQENFLNEVGGKIPEEFILPNLRLSKKLLDNDINEIKPGFNNNSSLWKSSEAGEDTIRERILYEFPIGSVWNSSSARNKLDEIGKALSLSDDQKLRIIDLKKYFDITRNDHSFKISRRK